LALGEGLIAGLSALEYLLRRERLVVAVGLAVVVASAWVYLATGAGMDTDMPDVAMHMPMPRSPFYVVLVFAMWSVMMIAIMVPSAAPTILLFATIRRKQATAQIVLRG
jgi:predicted metal-binding membrane protein